MKTATVTEFRSHAKEFLEQIEADRDILIISRPKSKEGFVVLTLSEYESMKETAYLLSSPANANRLVESITQDKANQLKYLETRKKLPKKS